MRAVTRAPYVSTDRKTCRHCEPPFQKWQELVNHDKGARQSDFDILSGVDGKKNCRLLRFARNDRLQIRHCEPPFQKWQELVNHDKGGWQSDFDFLSQNRWKKKNCGLPRRFAERNLCPTIKAKRLAMTRFLPSSCNSLTPLPPSKEGVARALLYPTCYHVRNVIYKFRIASFVGRDWGHLEPCIARMYSAPNPPYPINCCHSNVYWRNEGMRHPRHTNFTPSHPPAPF